MEQTCIAIFLSQKPESGRNKFSHFKNILVTREVLFSLDLFLFKFACRRKIARIFISSSQIDKIETHWLDYCAKFFFANLIGRKKASLGISSLRIKKYQKISKNIKEIPSLEKEFLGSASISMIHFWRESKAMSRRKSIVVKFFSIECLQWIANLG